jgi:DNA-binding NarL/FixJ family response regulator
MTNKKVCSQSLFLKSDVLFVHHFCKAVRHNFSGCSKTEFSFAAILILGMTKQYNLLLIEDNNIDTLLFKYSVSPLEDEWLVHLASNRYLSLEKMARMDAAGNLPDLIVLNYNLSDNSGALLLRDIRYSRKWRNVPVVLFCSYISEEQLIEANRYGILCFINKPLKMTEFPSCVEEIFMAWAHEVSTRMIA